MSGNHFFALFGLCGCLCGVFATQDDQLVTEYVVTLSTRAGGDVCGVVIPAPKKRRRINSAAVHEERTGPAREETRDKDRTETSNAIRSNTIKKVLKKY